MANPITMTAAIGGVVVGGLVGLVMLITTGAAEADSDIAPTSSIGALKSGTKADPYAQWINAAAFACPGLPAPVLAAQLQQESSFNPTAQSPVGAQGIAQFMPGTWDTWKVDANQNGVASPMEPPDAITAQGRFMCDLLRKAKASGYHEDLIRLALAGYNAGWNNVVQYRGIPPFDETRHYVSAILDSARQQFTAVPAVGGAVPLPTGFVLPPDTPVEVKTAIAWALKQVGTWYHYGGDCTQAHGSSPQHWCDCSSLVQQAYAAAGVHLPRVTGDQVRIGQAVRLDAPAPGDLVFSVGSDGTAASPGHVGMYIGSGYLIEAPHTGAQVRTVTFKSWATASSRSMQVAAIRRVVTG